MATKSVAGVSSEMTAEEVKDYEARIAEAKVNKKAEKDRITKVEADKASGNKKLKDLGLTDDEITALVG